MSSISYIDFARRQRHAHGEAGAKSSSPLRLVEADVDRPVLHLPNVEQRSSARVEPHGTATVIRMATLSRDEPAARIDEESRF